MFKGNTWHLVAIQKRNQFRETLEKLIFDLLAKKSSTLMAIRNFITVFTYSQEQVTRSVESTGCVRKNQTQQRLHTTAQKIEAVTLPCNTLPHISS
jgi:hypothetical protein